MRRRRVRMPGSRGRSGPVKPRRLPQSSNARLPSVALDDALAARGLEPAAKLVGLAGRRERPHEGTIKDPLRAKVGASNDGGPPAELPGELFLQRTKGRLRVGFAPLRGNLHDIAA